MLGTRFGRCLCTLLLESEDRWLLLGQGIIHLLAPLGETGGNGATGSLCVSKEGGRFFYRGYSGPGFRGVRGYMFGNTHLSGLNGLESDAFRNRFVLMSG